MKYLKSFLIFLALSLSLSGCSVPFFSQKKAALQVTSKPRATVFLDGKHVGQTPYFDENLKSGEYTLKLVPEDSTGSLPAWETQIKLSPQILTVVNRDIASSDDKSSGEILTLEPLSSKTKTALAVVSLPDSAIVKLNGQPKGFTPVNLDDVAPGEHTIVLSATGYQEKTIKAKLTVGHKLTLSVQLARESIIKDKADEEKTDNQDEDNQEQEEAETKASPKPQAQDNQEEEATQAASASASTNQKPYVLILDNDLGYLRIRKEPTTSSAEVAQAAIGQKLPYLNEESLGWYKVSYASGKSGWVSRGASGEYAKLVE